MPAERQIDDLYLALLPSFFVHRCGGKGCYGALNDGDQ